MNPIDIVCRLNKMWLSEKHVYPGPQPISIERKHFDILKSNVYYIGHKNDGERYALCCLRDDDKPRCLLLNRKLEIFPISLLISKKFYEGTILDCEIVDNKIYIFDCPLFSGTSLKTKHFHERLSFCKSFVEGCKKRESDKYLLCVKEFVLRKDYKQLQTCENSDGYIFVPDAKPVQTATHNTYFKWKPLLQNTIDFAICKDNRVCLQNAGKLCKVSDVKIEHNEVVNDTFIVECQYVNSHTWKALHQRTDKTIPNSLYTYKRTLVNIHENIQIEELVT